MSKSTVDKVIDLLGDYLNENGYELWHAEFVKAGSDFNLNIYIDKPGGIGTDDCEKVSKYLAPLLDEADFIDQNYYLVVSSPGMDRPLLKDDHFTRYTDELVDVSLYKGFEGSKKYSGTLVERTAKELILTTEDGAELRLPREIVSQVRLKIVL